jgi:hypothetical protein
MAGRVGYFGNETVITDLYFWPAGLLAELLTPQFGCGDSALVSPGAAGSGLGEAQLLVPPLMEVIMATGSALVLPVADCIGTDWGWPGDIVSDADCDVVCDTCPASCLLTRFSTEPKEEPALAPTAAEFALSKTDSAAACADAKGRQEASIKAKIAAQKRCRFIEHSSPQTRTLAQSKATSKAIVNPCGVTLSGAGRPENSTFGARNPLLFGASFYKNFNPTFT